MILEEPAIGVGSGVGDGIGVGVDSGVGDGIGEGVGVGMGTVPFGQLMVPVSRRLPEVLMYL